MILMPSVLQRCAATIDDLLRGRSLNAPELFAKRLPRLIAIVLVFGALYGAVMGAYGIHQRGHAIQILYGGLKVPMLLTISFCLSAPSFMVLNTLLGVRSDAAEVLHALLSMQAGLTVVLASLAPLTAFWYINAFGYDPALLFNGAMFCIATLSSQWMLRRAYRPLIARNQRHRLLLRFWVFIYSFVAIQMAWVLRPFIGDPSGPVTFFRRDAWGNAYVEILHIVMRSI